MLRGVECVSHQAAVSGRVRCNMQWRQGLSPLHNFALRSHESRHTFGRSLHTAVGTGQPSYENDYFLVKGLGFVLPGCSQNVRLMDGPTRGRRCNKRQVLVDNARETT